MWQLRLNRDGSSLDAGILKKRPTLPDWYLDRPEITDGDEFYLTAFDRLSTTRQTGFDAGRIPWDKIVHYASIKQLDAQATDMFVEVICAMDVGYLAYSQQARKEESAAPPPPRSVTRE